MNLFSSDADLSTTQLVAASGATTRQCDYWARCGVFPSILLSAGHPGSGSHRRWNSHAVPVAYVLHRLQSGGIQIEVRLLGEVAKILANYPVPWWPDQLVLPDASRIIVDLKTLVAEMAAQPQTNMETQL